jgi:hypothetical protein
MPPTRMRSMRVGRVLPRPRRQRAGRQARRLWPVLGPRRLAAATRDDLTAALTGEWAAPPAKEAKAAGEKIAAKAAEAGVTVTDDQLSAPCWTASAP